MPRGRALLHLQILSLPQQLAMVTARGHKRLRIRLLERLFRVWPGCLATLAVFQPDTSIRWHQRGFRLYWTWKSRRRRRTGRPATPPEIRNLIRQLSRESSLWGAPHVHGELQMLGIAMSQTTVAKYMIRHRKPRSQIWRTFLDNHVTELTSIDFFTVPTASFRILYIILDERHLYRVLRAYMTYYHTARTHLSLGKQCPQPRPIHPPDCGNVIAFPHLGGLNHEYRRAA